MSYLAQQQIQQKFNNARTCTQHYRGNELVSVESESDSDSETEPTQIIDRSPLYMSIAKLASKASFRGNDGAREWLKAIMGLPEDHVLPPFDDEIAKSLTELARQAFAAAQGDPGSVAFMCDFLTKRGQTETDSDEETNEAESDEETDETDSDACSDSHEETDETDSDEEPSDEEQVQQDAFHCIVCYQVATQERNPNKPCGRTKYLMDFQKRCRGCRVTEQQGA